MVTKGNPDGTRTGEVLREQMEAKNISIKDLADKIETTYEHTRSIIRGNVVPSKHMLPLFAKVLGLNIKELEKLAVADKIRRKYGKIPLELSGKNPELEPIERAWEKLSESHKQDIIAMVQTYARRDAQASKSKREVVHA
jgi:transcriptional regulator with XRE-family HTH domain